MLPRQSHESQLLEDATKALSLSKSTYIVQARIEANAMTMVALKTTAGNAVALQHYDMKPLLRQQTGADEGTKATADYHHITFHDCYYLPFIYPTEYGGLKYVTENHGREEAHDGGETYRTYGGMNSKEH